MKISKLARLQMEVRAENRQKEEKQTGKKPVSKNTATQSRSLNEVLYDVAQERERVASSQRRIMSRRRAHLPVGPEVREREHRTTNEAVRRLTGMLAPELDRARDAQNEELRSQGYRDSNLVDSTVRSFKRGNLQSALGQEYNKMRQGLPNRAAEIERELASDDYKYITDGLLERGVSGASELLGQMLYQSTRPETFASVGAGAAFGAGTASFLGNMGPQAVIPEEILTVPAGALTGAMAGFSAGSAKVNYDVEAGLAYKEMIDNGISEKTAQRVAGAVGLVNAGLELVQLDELKKSFRVLKGNRATHGLASRIAKELADRGVDVAKETGQEVLQEASTIAGAQYANQKEKGEWAYNAQEVGSRLADTAAAAALSFGTMNVPGGVRNVRAGMQKATALNKAADAVIENTRMVARPDSEAYRAAENLSAKRDAGVEITNEEVSALFALNRRAHEEAQNPPVTNETVPGVSLDRSGQNSAAQARQPVKTPFEERLESLGENGQKALRTVLRNRGEERNGIALTATQYYEAGLVGIPMEKMDRMEFAVPVTNDVKTAMYYAGQNDAAVSLAREKELAQFATVRQDDAGFVHNELSDKAFTRDEQKLLNDLGKATGRRYVVDDTVYGGAANGSYENGTVHIAADAENPFMTVAVHETTHGFQEAAPVEYRAFRDYAVSIVSEGQNSASVIEQYIQRAADAGVTLTEEAAMDEIASDFAGDILRNEETLRRFVEEGTRPEHRNMVRKFFDAVKDFVRKVKRVFKSDTKKQNQAAMDRYGMTMAQLEKAMGLWEDTLKSAVKAADQARQEGRVSDKDQGKVDERYSLNLSFPRKLDEWLANTGEEERLSSPKYFFVGTTSKALQSIGVVNYRIYFGQSKIAKIMEEHPSMTADVIKSVPDVLENPILVMQSQTVINRITLFGEVVDADGKPVLIALHLSQKNKRGEVMDFAVIASAYGKDNAQQLIDNSDILYVDSNKKRTNSWLRLLGLQLPSRVTNYGSIGSVTLVKQDVNGKISFGDNGGKTAMQEALAKAKAQKKPVKKYSLKESAGEKDGTIHTAKEYYGTTDRWEETGYLLRDGSQLDFSGRNEGASGGDRTVDHREILSVYEDDKEIHNGMDAMVDFMRGGNIRISPESAGINLSVLPTKEQEKALGRYIAYNNGEVIVDIDDVNGNTKVSVEYPKGTNEERVLTDIRKYFNDGIVPAVSDVERFRFSLKEDAAKWTSERIDWLYESYASKSSPNYSQAYAVYMSPDDFLSLTTTDQSRIEAKSRELDIDRMRKETQDIFLRYDPEDGEIYGHEGRHRMVALRNAGVNQVPVVIWFMGESGKYDRQPISRLKLRGQEFLDRRAMGRVTLKDLIPISYAYRTEIEAKFGAGDGDGISFSLKGQSDILRENAALRRQNEYLKRQIKTSKAIRMDEKALDRLARSILRETSSEYERGQLAKALGGLYETIVNTEAEELSWTDLKREAVSIASEVLNESSVLNDEMYHQYAGLREYLKETGITLSEADRTDFPEWKAFRRQYSRRLKLVEDGRPVDEVYGQLADRYPEFFDAEEQTHPADQLMQIADVLDSLQAVEENPYSANMQEAAEWLADDILERFFEVPQEKTYADKAERKLTRQKIHYEERVKRLLAREKERREKQQDRLKEKYRSQTEKGRDRRGRSELKNKIKKHVGKLERMLLRGTDNSHIPEGLRTSVADFLHCIDLDTDRIGPKTRERLTSLRREYEKIMDAERSGVYMEVDPDLLDNLDSIIDAVAGMSGTRLVDMTRDQLQILYRATLAIERSVYGYNRTLAAEKEAEISELGQMAMAENRTDKGYRPSVIGGKQAIADLLNMDMLAPEDFMDELGPTMRRLYRSIRKGFDRKILHTEEAAAYMTDLLKGTDAKKWAGKGAKTQEFRLISGGTIELTPAQVMSLYLLERQDDAKPHIYKGGIKPAPVVAREGKLRRPKVKQSYERVQVKEEDVRHIISSLTPEQVVVAEGISRFFQEYTAAWGNEVSMKLYGYKKFGIKNYFPIVSDSNYLNAVYGETNDQTLKNMGSTKSRIKGANNPVVIEDVFDVFTRQADAMANYNAFVLPLSDLQKVFNYKNDVGSVKQAVRKKYGDRAIQYFKKLMEDINGGARYQGGSAAVSKLIGNWKAARVGLNLRVILQQPSAYFRALAMIDAKYLLNPVDFKPVSTELIYKYAPIARWKNWGFFSMDVGPQMKEIFMNKRNWREGFMWPAQKADEMTWKRIWNAVELETRALQPGLEKGSEEYYRAVGKRFGEVIDRTQVVDSVLHRPQILRNPDTLVKMSVSFMSEPMKAYNLLRTAFREFGQNKTKATVTAVQYALTGYLSSVIINAVVTGLIDSMRGDDDDEYMVEKVWRMVTGQGDEKPDPKNFKERWLYNFVDNLVNEPLSMIPYLKDFVSILQGYTIKRTDMQPVADIITAAKRMGNDNFTWEYKIPQLLFKVADFYGIPGSNVKREAATLAKLCFNVADYAKADYEVSKKFYQVSPNKSMYVDILYDAYKAGDVESYEYIKADMIDRGVEKSYIDSGIRSRAKKDGLTDADIAKTDALFWEAGLKPQYVVEKEEKDEYDENDLSGAQAIEYDRHYATIVQGVMTEMKRDPTYSGLSDEAKEALIRAAIDYSENVALQDASRGLYDYEHDWIGQAERARSDLGISTGEYLMLKEEYSARALATDAIREAHKAGVDVRTYLEFRSVVSGMKSIRDKHGNEIKSKKDQVIDYLNSLGLDSDTYWALYATEYKVK